MESPIGAQVGIADWNGEPCGSFGQRGPQFTMGGCGPLVARPNSSFFGPFLFLKLSPNPRIRYLTGNGLRMGSSLNESLYRGPLTSRILLNLRSTSGTKLSLYMKRNIALKFGSYILSHIHHVCLIFGLPCMQWWSEGVVGRAGCLKGEGIRAVSVLRRVTLPFSPLH